jgi:antitoxin (DNA-binding transcriptional repressor) of toxin-antitoxin stability system
MTTKRTTKRMKSNEVRADWAEVMQYVRTGGTVVVEHYNKPVAQITPYIGELAVLTAIIATVPTDASRATAAEAWRSAAAEAGLKAAIVGNTVDGTPIVEYRAEQYGLVQDGTDVWPVPLRCSTCSTEPGSVPGEVFHLYRIDSVIDEVEFMCGTCWDRYGPEN